MQCTRTASLDVFFKDIRNINETKIAVVGCGCRTATESVAEISHYWNISQVITFLTAPYCGGKTAKLCGYEMLYYIFGICSNLGLVQ